MWPVDLYGFVGAALEVFGPHTIGGFGPETYETLGALERAGLHFGITLVAALVVLGLLQGYGPRTVTKARKSPIISICIGLPSLLVLAGLTSTGYLITGSSLGTFFGIPMVVLGGTAGPALTIFGLVAVGQSIGSRLGADRLWVGVLVGSVLAGIAGLSLALTAVTVVLAGSLGVGAGVRVMMGAGGTTHPSERTVPPANKV